MMKISESAFLPHKQGRTLDQAMTERKYKWIYSVKGEIQDILLYTPILIFFAILRFLGIIPFYMMSIDPSAPFFLRETENGLRMVSANTWLPLIASIIPSFSCILTLRGALRGTLILINKRRLLSYAGQRWVFFILILMILYPFN